MNSTKECTKIQMLDQGLTQIFCLAVSHSDYYSRMFSVLVSGCNKVLFMHGWFCPIHLIGRKSLHFEKTIIFSLSPVRVLLAVKSRCLPLNDTETGRGINLWTLSILSTIDFIKYVQFTDFSEFCKHIVQMGKNSNIQVSSEVSHKGPRLLIDIFPWQRKWFHDFL